MRTNENLKNKQFQKFEQKIKNQMVFLTIFV